MPAAAIPELAEGRLLDVVTDWLRGEAAVEAKKERAAGAGAGAGDGVASGSTGWAAGRMPSTLRGSGNTVMRM